MPQEPRWDLVDRLLELALAEDVGPGDATTEALVPATARARGHFVAREPGVMAGIEIVERLFARLDPAVKLTPLARDGAHVRRQEKLARVEGPARPILTGERLALNLLQRMSGVATLTRTYVEAVASTKAKILDTRKTMPGMRVLDKLAVYVGGGENHRRGLYDMILIKDNHLRLAGPSCPAGSTACAVANAKEASSLPVMVEVDTLDQLREAIEMEPDFILLDNMDADTLREAVELTHVLSRQHDVRRPLLEASGGVTLQTVRDLAATGVDRISVGALTHSAVALDIGLDFDG